MAAGVWGAGGAFRRAAAGGYSSFAVQWRGRCSPAGQAERQHRASVQVSGPRRTLLVYARRPGVRPGSQVGGPCTSVVEAPAGEPAAGPTGGRTHPPHAPRYISAVRRPRHPSIQRRRPPLADSPRGRVLARTRSLPLAQEKPAGRPFSSLEPTPGVATGAGGEHSRRWTRDTSGCRTPAAVSAHASRDPGGLPSARPRPRAAAFGGAAASAEASIPPTPRNKGPSRSPNAALVALTRGSPAAPPSPGLVSAARPPGPRAPPFGRRRRPRPPPLADCGHENKIKPEDSVICRNCGGR